MKILGFLVLAFSLAVLCTGNVLAQAVQRPQLAEGWTEAKAARLAKKQLVYLWIGNASPGSSTTPYGFNIRSVGCTRFSSYTWHNRLVVAKINAVYGWRWFQKHRLEIAYGRKYANVR